ncbi:unnamed protein product, partial [marine sediment metagenome]
IEATKDRPVSLTNVGFRYSRIKPGTTIEGKDINAVLRRAYLGRGKYENCYFFNTVIPAGRRLVAVARGPVEVYEYVGIMSEEKALAQQILNNPSIIDEVLDSKSKRDAELNLVSDDTTLLVEGRIESIAAALWYLRYGMGENIDGILEEGDEIVNTLKEIEQYLIPGRDYSKLASHKYLANRLSILYTQ